MTRKRVPSIPPWRSVAGYGEPGDLIERGVVPSAAYRARYVVRTLGRLDPWEVHRVTITDRETGAVATLPGVGSGGRLEFVADHAPGYVERFWKDSLYLAGRARLGRPSGLTNVENDEQLYAVIRDMRTAGRRVTLPTVAANSTYTVSAIRNYLRLTGRKWVEFRGPR